MSRGHILYVLRWEKCGILFYRKRGVKCGRLAPDQVNSVGEPIHNTELKDLRIITCLRKIEVSVKRISVCCVIDKIEERGKHRLRSSGTNDVIYLFL